MQFVLSPLFKKMNKDLKLSYEYTVNSIRDGIFLLDLEMLKHFADHVSVGCFTRSGQQISNIDDCDEDVIFIRPAVVVGGSKAFRIILGVVLIVVGVILTFFDPSRTLGVGLIMYGAGMLLNEFLTPKPTIPDQTTKDDFQDAPTYSFANFAQKIGEQYPVPLIYGYSTSSGVLIDYVENGKVFFRGDANTIHTIEKIIDAQYVTIDQAIWIDQPVPNGTINTYFYVVYEDPEARG